MRSRRTTTRVLLVAVALSIGATLAGAAPGASKPRWQAIPGIRPDPGSGAIELGWAANRVWFVFADSQRGMTATSAKVAGTFSSFVTTHISKVRQTSMHIVGSDLIYSVEGSSKDHVCPACGLLRDAPLLDNGRLGSPTVLSDEPEQAAASLKPGLDFVGRQLGPNAAVRVGDRLVWTITGGTGQRFKLFAACCDETGGASDLTRFVSGAGPLTPQLGIDTRGRLWLAWGDHRLSPNPRMVELDPTTLAPRSSKPFAAPGGHPTGWELVCAATCRLVMSQREGMFSWAPGERSLTKIVGTSKPGAEPWFLGATYSSGELGVAYWANAPSLSVEVTRGDSRGARSRVVSSSVVPNSAGSGSLQYYIPHGTFVPAGFVAIQLYDNGRGVGRVLTALLPFR